MKEAATQAYSERADKPLAEVLAPVKLGNGARAMLDALVDILAGARADDKKAAAKAGNESK